jgi:hypothetical protein
MATSYCASVLKVGGPSILYPGRSKSGRSYFISCRGSLAMLAAMRRASSRVSYLARMLQLDTSPISRAAPQIGRMYASRSHAKL